MTIPIVMTGILGLLMGSFLNVVIYRLPNMSSASYNLLLPRSFCPHCHISIRAIDNVPLVSYLMLQGKCRSCHHPIAPRYLLVEILCCLLFMMITWHFGAFTLQTSAALVLTCSLIALSCIDFEHFLLPDAITLPCLWLGLVFSLGHTFQSPESCILGAVLGYLSLWTVYQIFKYLTAKEGIGYGDFKLLAMLGAWLGWQSIPFIILIASILGSLIGISLILFKGNHKDTPIPFGPYLAIGGFVAMLWQNKLIGLYLNFLLL